MQFIWNMRLGTHIWEQYLISHVTIDFMLLKNFTMYPKCPTLNYQARTDNMISIHQTFTFLTTKPGHHEICFQTRPINLIYTCMMTSLNGTSFALLAPLWGESTGRRWIPLTKASDAELSCFLWSRPEQTVEQTLKTPVIWDAIVLMLTLL